MGQSSKFEVRSSKFSVQSSEFRVTRTNTALPAQSHEFDGVTHLLGHYSLLGFSVTGFFSSTLLSSTVRLGEALSLIFLTPPLLYDKLVAPELKALLISQIIAHTSASPARMRFAIDEGESLSVVFARCVARLTLWRNLRQEEHKCSGEQPLHSLVCCVEEARKSSTGELRIGLCALAGNCWREHMWSQRCAILSFSG